MRRLVWLRVLRIVVGVLLTFHVSGAAHLMGDLVEIATHGAHPPVDDDEQEDGPCRPGSPTCHHAHPGSAPLSFGGPGGALVERPAPCPVAAPSWNDDVPAGPSLPTVFRPPKHAALSIA